MSLRHLKKVFDSKNSLPNCQFKMNSKHLAKGSPCPPHQEGKLRFYNMRFCAYTQRPLLVAGAKGIPLDIVNVNPKEKPEWLFDKNPEGKLPIVETKEGCLYESLLVSEYFDEVYAIRPLYPKDPFKKILDKIWVENISKVTTGYYKVLGAAGDDEIVKKGINELITALETFEGELQRRKTIYFAGNEAPGMLDYMLWPWIERIPIIKILLPNAYDFEAGKEKNPAMERWIQAMKKDPAVEAIFITPENHAIFAKSKASGKPNYDLLAD